MFLEEVFINEDGRLGTQKLNDNMMEKLLKTGVCILNENGGVCKENRSAMETARNILRM